MSHYTDADLAWHAVEPDPDIMLNQAVTAVAYLRETLRTGTITPAKVRHVRRFLERLEMQHSLVFHPAMD
jgi:hypothetical protein